VRGVDDWLVTNIEGTGFVRPVREDGGDLVINMTSAESLGPLLYWAASDAFIGNKVNTNF